MEAGKDKSLPESITERLCSLLCLGRTKRGFEDSRDSLKRISKGPKGSDWVRRIFSEFGTAQCLGFWGFGGFRVSGV